MLDNAPLIVDDIFQNTRKETGHGTGLLCQGSQED